MDHHLDARAARIAERQLGLVTGGQARGIGFTRHQIDRRIVTDRWTRVTRDVFAVRGSPPSWRRDALAACLAGPPGTVASYGTAAALWGFGPSTAPPHVTVPRSAGARLPIATVHRSALSRADVTRIGGIPVTRVGRTLVDLSSIWTARALEHAVDSVLDDGMVSTRHVVEAMRRCQRGPGRAGLPALSRALDVWTAAIRPGSPAEARLVRRLGEWGLPEAELQHVVRTADGEALARIDVSWPQHHLGLEYDGLKAHGPRHFEHDQLRHEAVEALGWDVLHVDRVDLRPGETSLRARLTAALRRPAA